MRLLSWFLLHRIIIKEGVCFAIAKTRHGFYELALKGKANLNAKNAKERKINHRLSLIHIGVKFEMRNVGKQDLAYVPCY